ncbi:hypothetical protein M427DRAFT_235935 [Gonapodya prolifera JEL478]|uniref:Cation-transporting ATPase n=1 Tax=Gonapodya prolifera (strain JEL478) TaxID=1344416 RepID=A0A139AN45_GONPJ|nr:hypothetical protein M427DRAFT_235935 [Gonapodya prolifera JEL478]|eukprot:KXS17953.1 hypothetical protein M427DRAFT_235935 [Gonapodya prolifera JEL478]
MPQSLVKSKSIETASLHTQLPLVQRLYVWPFFFLYAAYAYVLVAKYDEWLASSEAATLVLIICVSLNVLAVLMCQWNVTIKAYVVCRKETNPFKADFIRIIPIAHHGSGAFCEIKSSLFRDPNTSKLTTQVYFHFQKKKYTFDNDKKIFVKLDYPTSGSHSLEMFQSARGFATEDELKYTVDKYGPNKFDIPIPSFQELFQEHLIAPFFVFQIFCVALWFLDEMWYYSLFTLFMLFVFESTVVMQRLQSLKEMHSMGLQPYQLHAYRNRQWVKVMTDHLYPGDLVSIVRTKEDSAVPCDVLLLDGTAIVNEAMLSGESTPLLKESIAQSDSSEILDIASLHKNNVLFGGTKVLQATPPSTRTDLVPPDHGAVGYVLRTGFGTSQGKLVRTILFSSERVTANNVEAFVFIVFLLIFAVLASAYVWVEGTKNDLRKKSKILLDCVLIITSVVPPELPMELSLAVNNSLIALARVYIFCTEPFRIPFAGKLDVLAFDKTGTLTDSTLVVEGVAGLETDPSGIRKPYEVPTETTMVLAAAHALVFVDETVVGDPMERSTVASVGWLVGRGDLVTGQKGASLKGSIKIMRRFQFSSALKRMASVASYDNGSGSYVYFIGVKGAPETLRSMYAQLPPGYDACYKYWARRGSRVLALGYKQIRGTEIKDMSRDQAESSLRFAGFLIFHCPLKPHTVDAVKSLSNSSHRVIMITGDNPLTACHVAAEVGITKREVLILEENGNGGLTWDNLDETISIPMDPTSAAIDKKLFNYDLCITGKAMAQLAAGPQWLPLLPRLWVFARISPSQKELILTSLKQLGYTTLMCGDGTNDVGALKQAHVGVALLDASPEDLQKLAERMRDRRQQEMKEKQKQLAERWGVKLPPEPVQDPNKKNAIAEKSQNGGVAKTPAEIQAEKQKEMQRKLEEKMNNMLSDMDQDVPTIKFGDASVASPFTSKVSTINSVCNIVRQGRATLVAMLQMYKILALNCIVSAYSMSVLYLAGIKQGDWQATIAGLLITVCFFAIARSQPLNELSKKRPQSSIFNLYFFLSVLGQCAVHVSALHYIRGEAILASTEMEEEIDLDAKFQPNLLNTAIYLVSLTMQISTFAINYQGRPFREGLTENKPLYHSILAVGTVAVVGATQVVPLMNDWMQLVPMTDIFQTKLLTTMALDFGLAMAIETVTSYLFSDNKPKASLLLD